MGKIKFRAKRTKFGSWVFGSLLTCDDGAAAIMGAKHTWMNTYVEVDPKTIGQFTGLRDRNDNEIYEGDIIKGYFSIKGQLYEVVFLDGMFYAKIDRFSDKAIGGFPLWHFCIKEKGYTCEVVGNIHDNSELLTISKNVIKQQIQ